MLFVLVLTVGLGLITAALTVMWRSEIQTRTAERDGLLAFYLAQAGLEHAKAQLATAEGWQGDITMALGEGTYRIFQIQGVPCGGGPYQTCRAITANGKVRDAALQIVAARRITARVSLDTDSPNPPNTPGDEAQLADTWMEPEP